ncbi:class I SAM-dependent methyltransferase [Frankia sp. CNm7]|nr:class I SAM-dependent methyltransferase [Frankia nepalensis]MBL7508389.1 class I SAM-dependent methyltransferase [Frankia nepalensis]MBL7517389.1 class I SAM-dependent methyltransferase [Frankia nepalensis]
MTGQIASALALTAADRIADVGCGTGLFARRLVELVRPAAPVLCVDPSEGMLSQLPDDPGLVPVQASAEQLARRPEESRVPVRLPSRGSLTAVVVKEAIHHVAAEDRSWVVAGLAGLLAPGGRLLVVMLPTTIGYPLFDAALERFTQLQPNPEDIAGFMRAAGLTASVAYQEFELAIPKDRYLAMVRDRYMSLLASFSDAEIDAGVADIDAHHPGPVLVFPDRFAFVLGTRLEAR